MTRLVKKSAVRREGINERHYIYFPVVTEKEYIERNRQRLINKVFDGSVNALLLNFIKEEKISKEDLDKLYEQIGEDK